MPAHHSQLSICLPLNCISYMIVFGPHTEDVQIAVQATASSARLRTGLDLANVLQYPRL